jgi:hypothetical protein
VFELESRPNPQTRMSALHIKWKCSKSKRPMSGRTNTTPL